MGLRLTAIPDSEEAHHCWRCGWDDADTEMLELARHRKALAKAENQLLLGARGVSYLTLAAMRE